MVFDKNLPANTTKISDAPSIFNANFAAIEEGQNSLKYWQANFIERNAVTAAPPVTPNPIDDTMIVYSRRDTSSGETELFFEDDRLVPNDIQVTQDGKLGSTDTDINAKSVSFDGTFENNQNAMVTAWSNVTVVGAAISTQTNYGMSWTRTSVGVYKATFTASQVTNANYAVTGMAFSLATGQDGHNISIKANATQDTVEFSINIRHSTSDTLRDLSFMVAVFGGR